MMCCCNCSVGTYIRINLSTENATYDGIKSDGISRYKLYMVCVGVTLVSSNIKSISELSTPLTVTTILSTSDSV